jgi:hypothetical protein
MPPRANNTTPDATPRSLPPRMLVLLEPDGQQAIAQIQTLLARGGDIPRRTYRARRAGAMSRRAVLGDKEDP